MLAKFAVETRYVGQTDTKPARILVREPLGKRSRYHHWGENLSEPENHEAAALAWAETQEGCPATFIKAETRRGYLFIFDELLDELSRDAEVNHE